MYVDADKRVAQMKGMSQYSNEPDSAAKAWPAAVSASEHIRVGDEEVLPEDEYQLKKQKDVKNAFFKVKNDPRITRVGKFIRRTSIDELPQLINVLRGEMSLVGNRPLPLYEAEKITEDTYIERFNAPAGITGFWQVTDRGKDDMDVTSRKAKDVFYARNANFFLDLWILFKTPLAAIQKVNA
jgi:lipopolysaccharide/colanic/teichoic acid biosynthesis glycosyltransferase